MRRPHLLLSLVVLVSACGDDSIHHLADAPDLPIDAPPDAQEPKVALNIVMAGSGSGTVTSSPAGISCTTASCSADFEPETVVTLTAVPGTGSVFGGWSGACTGALPTCDVTLANAAMVTATFDVARYAVTVAKSGTGSGVVAGNGLDCGTTCTMMVDHGTVLSLTAAPGNLSVFAGWGGACSGMASCMVTVTGATAITANFALDDVTLFVTKGGNGAGTVTAPGISCGGDCDEPYTAGQMVTLTAAAATGSTFTGWSGSGCTGTATCTVTMTAATTVTATFTLRQLALNVAKGGNGSGSVVSNPTGIACGTNCMEDYNYNTMVVLTATPSTGSMFTGWSGACTGTLQCMLTMTAAKNVTATFTLQQFALMVSLTGSGLVTSAPAGVSCPTDCTKSYSYGTMVTLTAAAATGWTFTGWGGACTGMGTCSVTMDTAKNVTAAFTLLQFPLTVTKAGAGTGTVTSAPAGISCGASCSHTFNYGTSVTLMASAVTGSTFAGWSGGGCTGSGSCVTTVTGATSVTATFTLTSYLLTVTRAGAGSGTVTSSPAGVNCGSNCTEPYLFNTIVTLTAVANPTTSDFSGWNGGGCTGTGTCTVTMSQAQTVTATFGLKQMALRVTKSGDGVGTVSGNGVSCGATCNVSLPYGTVVTLSATAGTTNATLSTFTGWTGAGCTGAGQCSFTITAATAVDAAFKLRPNLMFVTSGTFNGNLGGIGGADSICRAAANTKNLPGNYLAYISGGTTAARTRFPGASGWVRVDNRPVMNSIDQFGGGVLFNAPLLDEAGNDLSQTATLLVWTATNADGTYFGQNCNDSAATDWDSTQARTIAGTLNQTGSTVVRTGIRPCGEANRLYCLGTDRLAIAQ